MGRNKTSDTEALKYKVFTRVNETKYKQLIELVARTNKGDISTLLRDILYNRPIKTITRDTTFDNTMQELVKLRTEIKAIGININQITRYFNTYPEKYKKEFYAKTAFDQYATINKQIDSLLTIIEKLSLKWLSN